MKEIVENVMAEMKALPTRAVPVSTPTPPKKAKRMADYQTFGDPKLALAKVESQRFVDAVKDHPHRGQFMLSLLGNSGVGKTMLSKCILSELGFNQWGTLDAVGPWVSENKIMRSETQYRDWRKVSDKIKSGEYDIVDALELPFLLVLDDVGAEYDPNGFVASKLDRILRVRRGKWTVLTCNLLLAGIAERMDQRIASFMIRDGNTAVEIETKDYSLRQ